MVRSLLNDAVSSMNIAIGKRTDIGCVREANEDSFYVELPSPGEGSPDWYALLVVADGMGGQVAGKEASETAVEIVKSLFATTVKTDWAKATTVKTDWAKATTVKTDWAKATKAKAKKPLKDIRKFILDAFRQANQAVFKRGKARAAEMGTTLTVAVVDTQNAYIGSVGDSRAYHVRGRDIRQVTEDHTLAEDMVKKGKATREEMRRSPMRGMLTRAIGTKEEVAIDEPIGIELMQGDCLVLCTDGLTNLVEEQEILSVVHNTADLQKACNKLVEMARTRGGHDNITVVAAEFGTLERIKGLGIKAKTMRVKGARPGKKRMIIIVAIGLLVAIFIVLAYLFILQYSGRDGFYQRPRGEGQTEMEGTGSP